MNSLIWKKGVSVQLLTDWFEFPPASGRFRSHPARPDGSADGKKHAALFWSRSPALAIPALLAAETHSPVRCPALLPPHPCPLPLF